ncbi:putative G-protein coupled receptor 33 [Carettochelys insculpta]|uniref:putative G-protein coupled receptor 33 n=1 Tax=Carettochelys insculpta TaxID=44489 RepID=UPI003EC059B4
MEQSNTTLPSETWANSSQSPAPMGAPYMAAAMLLFATFLVGLVGNGLYLWVLVMKMKRTVTTIWFLHLVSCSVLFTLLIPFFTVYILLGFHWVFGTGMCKVLSACTHLGMFSSAFLLALISLDRYTFTCHPIWSRRYRTMSWAQKLVAGVWLCSFALSVPYLVFQETSELESSRITCVDYYDTSRDQDRAETQAWRQHTHVVLFLVRFLLGFLLPFCIIAGCYSQMGLKMMEKGLARSGKPFKVMVAAVVSFFFGWLPYHLYYGLTLFKDLSKSLMGICQLICIAMFCFNVCFTPILYLFVGQTFHQVLRTSLFTLVKTAFYEDLDSDGVGPDSSGRIR